MRTLSFVLLLMIAVSSCRKLPDTSELSSDFVVYTNYDLDADFTSYGTFAMPENVGQITDNPNDSILDGELAEPLIEEVRQQLIARGYTEVSRDDNPELGVGMTVLKNVTVWGGWYPGGWWGYPGYGGGCYYYYCGYYPGYPGYYPVYYVSTTGSVVIELIDLENADIENERLPVIWTNFNAGALGSTSENMANALNSIDQAFLQSPYISAN